MSLIVLLFIMQTQGMDIIQKAISTKSESAQIKIWDEKAVAQAKAEKRLLGLMSFEDVLFLALICSDIYTAYTS